MFWIFGHKNTITAISKVLIVFIAVLFATYLNRKSTEFLMTYPFLISNIIFIWLVYDYYFSNISGSQFLFKVWWIIAIIMAELGLFVGYTLFSKDNYKKFFKRFWINFTPLFLFTFLICFIRTPFSGRSVNLIPFADTFPLLTYFINNPNGTFEAPLIFFGNMLIFVPVPFMIKTYFKKANNKSYIIFGFVLPFLVEGYQYVLSCGDVDIDDIILNCIGYFIGYFVLKQINKKHSLTI